MKGYRYVARLRRMRLLEKDGGETLAFQIMDRTPAEFLDTGDVPYFEGEEAWFEIERARGPVWMTWKVLRQVQAPETGHGRAQP